MLRLPAFEYHRPSSLTDACALLERHAGDIMPIAGGTDLLPNMKHRLFTPGHVVSLKSVGELRGIDVHDDELSIGAVETLSTIARNPAVRRHAPSLAEAAGLVAGPQLRAMGTIGGNVCLDTRCTYYNQTYFWRHALGFCLKKDGDVCHVTRVGRKCVAAHSADTPPVLMTLDASVDLISPDGTTRAVPVREFFVADGIHNTVRRPGELVVRVRVPLAGPRVRTAYRKLRQRSAIDFPLLSVAAAAELEPDGTVASLTIVVSALGARPRLLTGLERIANGHRLDDDVIAGVAERAFQQCHPLENIIVDPQWRRAMVPVHVARALRDIAKMPPAAAA